MERGEPRRPIGVVRSDPDGDVVIQARYAPVTRGVVEIDPALTPALDGLDGFDWAWLVTSLDRAVRRAAAGSTRSTSGRRQTASCADVMR